MQKKKWVVPILISHGLIEDITQQLNKPKMQGALDDFGQAGISVF